LKDVIPALWTISCDVSKGPDCLLSNVEHGRVEEVDKLGNSSGLNDDLSVIGGARGYIGECPGSLELENYQTNAKGKIKKKTTWSME
jgi:hypothetical protein